MKALTHYILFAVVFVGAAMIGRAQGCEDDPFCLDESIYSLSCNTSLNSGYCRDDLYVSYGTADLSITAEGDCGPDSELGAAYDGDGVSIAGCYDPWELSVYASYSNSYSSDGDYTLYLGTLTASASGTDEVGTYGSWNGYAWSDCDGDSGGSDDPTVSPC
jgi:hypothetical protein